MRHLVRTFICLVFVLNVTVVYGLPVDNIAIPVMLKKGLVMQSEGKVFSIIVVPQAEIVTDRMLEGQQKDTKYKFVGGKAGIVINDKAFLYGVAGMADAEQEYLTSGNRVGWHTDFDLSWGGGATIVLFEAESHYRNKGMIRVGVDAQYRNSDLDVEKVTLNDVVHKLDGSSLSSAGFDCQEWQVALGVSYQTDRFAPYAGVKYSEITGDAKATISGTTYEQVFDPEKTVGMFVGMDFFISDSSSVNFEARFMNEIGYSVNGKLRF